MSLARDEVMGFIGLMFAVFVVLILVFCFLKYSIDGVNVCQILCGNQSDYTYYNSRRSRQPTLTSPIRVINEGGINTYVYSSSSRRKTDAPVYKNRTSVEIDTVSLVAVPHNTNETKDPAPYGGGASASGFTLHPPKRQSPSGPPFYSEAAHVPMHQSPKADAEAHEKLALLNPHCR